MVAARWSRVDIPFENTNTIDPLTVWYEVKDSALKQNQLVKFFFFWFWFGQNRDSVQEGHCAWPSANLLSRVPHVQLDR